MRDAVRNLALQEGGRFSFRHPSGGEQLLCALTYALGCLQYLDDFDEWLRGKESGILNSLKSCWCEDVGAFSKAPGGQVSIISTRLALHMLRLLLQRKSITKDQLHWLKPASILKYVQSNYIAGGFTWFAEGAIVPSTLSLYSTRSALSIIKSLEILRLNGDIKDEPEYLSRLYSLVAVVEANPYFVERCRDAESGGYFEVPADFAHIHEKEPAPKGTA